MLLFIEGMPLFEFMRKNWDKLDKMASGGIGRLNHTNHPLRNLVVQKIFKFCAFPSVGYHGVNINETELRFLMKLDPGFHVFSKLVLHPSFIGFLESVDGQ